jgi:hypothetical protein
MSDVRNKPCMSHYPDFDHHCASKGQGCEYYEPEDHIATIELSAKGVQQEHGISFEDACWVVDKMRDSNETNESLSFSEGYFVDEVKGKNEGRNR